MTRSLSKQGLSLKKTPLLVQLRNIFSPSDFMTALRKTGRNFHVFYLPCITIAQAGNTVDLVAKNTAQVCIRGN